MTDEDAARTGDVAGMMCGLDGQDVTLFKVPKGPEVGQRFEDAGLYALAYAMARGIGGLEDWGEPVLITFTDWTDNKETKRAVFEFCLPPTETR